MTKGVVLKSFFSRFMTAYPSSSVPEDTQLPYLTYDQILDSWTGGEVGLTVNMWFHSDIGDSEPNARAEELSKAIGPGGVVLPCDGGYIWLKRGRPWCQSLSDDTDHSIKRRYINVTAEYLTEN